MVWISDADRKISDRKGYVVVLDTPTKHYSQTSILSHNRVEVK
jgi:hypothetical protein